MLPASPSLNLFLSPSYRRTATFSSLIVHRLSTAMQVRESEWRKRKPKTLPWTLYLFLDKAEICRAIMVNSRRESMVEEIRRTWSRSSPPLPSSENLPERVL